MTTRPAAPSALTRLVRIWSWRLNLARHGGHGDLASPDDEALLDHRERRRADGFVFPRDRRRFVTTHATMRRILGQCVGAAPESLSFTLGNHGKPFLRHEPGWPTLDFSLSHTDESAILAVSLDGPVGIDIERIRPIDVGLSWRYFAPEEIAFLDSHLGPSRQMTPAWQDAFFAIWTVKEAVLKALGRGLSMPLDSFAIALTPEPRLVRLDEAPDTVGDWQIETLDTPDGIAGAIAFPSSGWALRYEPLPSGNGDGTAAKTASSAP